MNDLNITRSDLGGTPYAFLDAIVFGGDVYAVQKYISGAECRLVKFDRNADAGMLSFGIGGHWTVKSAVATLTDAALAVWHDHLFVFWKHTGSHWQVNYRSYTRTPDGKLLNGLLAEYDNFTVEPDCHCYNYIDAVVYKGALYLLMAVNRDKKDRIELRRCTEAPTDLGKVEFVEKVTFVSNGSTQVTDIDNSDTDTWDACVWHDPSKADTDTSADLLVVGRIHNGRATAYTWDGSQWSTAVSVDMPDDTQCSTLKLVQAAPLTAGSGTADSLWFVYTHGKDNFMIRRYLPTEKRFDGAPLDTGTAYGWAGVAVVRHVTDAADAAGKKRPKQYQDEVHIISGRECHHNYDTMVKSVTVAK